MTLPPKHIISGANWNASGFVALFALKGAKLDRKSGMTFVFAILSMSASGASQ